MDGRSQTGSSGSRARIAEDDTDFLAALLERNFLVTSSNIVCRTDFLRSRAESLRGLKYCFDWQLFLEAAVDRGLVYLPEELLGYRLHGSNTVWFDEERQAEYGLEVNRVLARTMRVLKQRASSETEIGAEAERILALLADHATKHSEADPFALYRSSCWAAGHSRTSERATEPRGSSGN